MLTMETFGADLMAYLCNVVKQDVENRIQHDISLPVASEQVDRVPPSGVNRLSRNDPDGVSLSRSNCECHRRVFDPWFERRVDECHGLF